MFMSIINVTYPHYGQICVVSVYLLLHSPGPACSFISKKNGTMDLLFSFQRQKVKAGFERKMSINKGVKLN